MNMMLRPPPVADNARDLAEIRHLRDAIADRIERDIAMLDALDGDPDLEPDGTDEDNVQPELRGGAHVGIL